MSDPAIARRYARALYETAALASDQDSDARDMGQVETILASIPGLRERCTSGRDGRGGAETLVSLAFAPYVGERVGRLLSLMAENGRLEDLPFLPAAYRYLLQSKALVIPIQVDCASEPSDEVLAQIRGYMAQRTGHDIDLHVHIVPSLLGGFRFHWQNRLLDLSLAGRIHSLRQALNTP